LNLPFNFDRALEGISKVTLRGGVVGKVSFCVVFVSLALAGIAWSVQNTWVSVGALVGVFVIAFCMLWRLINFADRHPQAALLEGAEFLVHEQIVHASKSDQHITTHSTISVQPEPVEGSAADIELAQLPDEDVALAVCV